MNRNNKIKASVVLAFFLVSGLNMCMLFLPAPVEAVEVTAVEKVKSPCQGKNMDHGKMAHKKSPANYVAKADTNNKKTNTVLPCCENHDRGNTVDIPREKISFGQIDCPAQIDFKIIEPRIVKNSSDILVVDLPPPEADLIASVFKRE